MKFSVLLPIHNKINLKDITKSIKTIYNNSAKPSEVITVIDGKINKEKKNFLKHYQSKNKNFKIFYKKKIGLSKILNFGLKKCSNELVFRADADDFNKSNRFKTQLNLYKNKSFDILGAQVEEKYKKTSFKKKLKSTPKLVDFLFRNPINHMTVMFKKSEILKVGGYPNITYKEDYALWIKCYLNGLKVKNINKVLVSNYLNDNFFERRSNFVSILSEFKLLAFAIKNNPVFILMLLPILVRIIIFLMPKFIYKVIFFNFLRNN